MKKATDVVVQKLHVMLELIFVAGLLIPLGLSLSCPAQSDSQLPVSESVENAPQQQPDTQPDDDFAPHSDGDTDAEQPATDLQTGLPLRALLTPLHLSNLSLLSFTAYEGYNSNPEYLRIPLSSYLTSMSGLVLYSFHFAEWQMDAQYHPFVWLSSRATFKSFAATSLDLRTVRRINGNWHWTLADRFRYAPTQSTEQQPGFVAEPGGGFSVGNAFLSSGRNILSNGAVATLTDHYSENSSLAFHAKQSVTRLSSYIGILSSETLPAQDVVSFSSGVTWRHHYSFSSAVSLNYSYLAQTSIATTVADVQTHSAGIGWIHKLNPTLGVSAAFGPAWSIYNQHHNMSGPSPGRTTLHGSLALSKQFRRGGAVLAFARSDGFSGIISDSFQNRYDLTVFRHITTRLHCSASGSYVQQQFLNSRNTNGELASGEARYYLSHNWALFAQVRYLTIAGSERFLAPETNVIAGFRWGWSPERP